METLSGTDRKSLLDLIETIVASSRRFPISTQKIVQEVSREDNSRRRHLIEAQLQKLVDEAKLILLPGSIDPEYFHENNLRHLQHRILDRLDCHHRTNPSSPGMSRSELRLTLSEDKTRNHQRIIDGRILEIVIDRAIREHKMVLAGEHYSKAGFHPIEIKPDISSVKQSEIYRKLFNLFNNQNPGVNSPERLETRLRMKKREIIETLRLLLDQNEIVCLEKNRYISTKVMNSIKSKISDLLSKQPGMYITDIADVLGMSRKSLSPVLDYLDRTGFTIRKGDYRYLTQLQPTQGSHVSSRSMQKAAAHLVSLLILVFLTACDARVQTIKAEEVTGTVSPTAASTGETQPRIEFMSQDHDFGKVVAGQAVSTSFDFRNTGSADLVIESVKAGCGCTAALASSKTVSPGDEGQINVKFNTSGRHGRQTKSVTVRTNDPAQPEIRLSFSADITVWLAFSPQHLYFGNIWKDQIKEKIITGTGEKVGSARLVSMRILDPSHADFYEIRTQTPDGATQNRDQDAQQPLIIGIKPSATMPVGPFSDTLIITTNLPELPEIDVIIKGKLSVDGAIQHNQGNSIKSVSLYQ